MSETVRYHIVVSGRVQGVGYRFFVIEEAERLGLHGWVRNLPDGRVEAEVEGPEEAVKDLVKLMHAGPRMSHVTNLVTDRLEGTVPYHDFRVR